MVDKDIEPGTHVFTVKKEGYAVIVDEEHGKPLAIGISLFDATEMEELTSGKAVLNVHYVGDELWNSRNS